MLTEQPAVVSRVGRALRRESYQPESEGLSGGDDEDQEVRRGSSKRRRLLSSVFQDPDDRLESPSSPEEREQQLPDTSARETTAVRPSSALLGRAGHPSFSEHSRSGSSTLLRPI